MELDLVIKLEQDGKLHDYLLTHSYWYRLLNRDKEEFEEFMKEYKNFKRERNMDKVNNTIDNIELITNIVKFME